MTTERDENIDSLSWHELRRLAVSARVKCDTILADRDRLRYLLEDYRRAVKNAQDESDKLRVEVDRLQAELAASKQDAAPLFEVGKCYKNYFGETRGPLESTPLRYADHETYPLYDGQLTYTLSGRWLGDSREDDSDLLPGAVDPPPPTHKFPASLPDGEYLLDDFGLYQNGACLSRRIYLPKIYRDWTDPPRVGRWLVKDSLGTWQGDA